MSELILTWSVSRVYSDTRSKKGLLLCHLLSRTYDTWRCCCLFLVVVFKVLFLLESVSASGTKTTVVFILSVKPMEIHSAVEKCHGLDQLMQTAFDCLSARCVLPWLSASESDICPQETLRSRLEISEKMTSGPSFLSWPETTTLTSSSTLRCVNKSCVL